MSIEITLSDGTPLTFAGPGDLVTVQPASDVWRNVPCHACTQPAILCRCAEVRP